MRKFWIGLALLLLMLPTQAQAVWEAAFYVEYSLSPLVAELRLYRSDGEVTVMPLPSNLSYGENISLSRRDVLVSADRRYVVMSEYNDEPFYALPIRIADLQNGTCCLEVAPLDTVDAYDFASFEPNGSRFAVSYVSDDHDRDPETHLTGGMMVVDAATGAITTNVLMQDAIVAANLIDYSAWALMETWEADGIRFTGNCFACGGAFEGQFALWRPDIGDFVANPGISFSIFGTRLDATGEFLLMTQNTAYSFNPSGGMFLTPNVVHYYRANEGVDFTTGQAVPDAPVIYFNTDAISLADVQWVADGVAFVVAAAETDFWDVVFRDGRVERIPFSGVENKALLGGTPDGWLERFTDAAGNTVVVDRRMNNTQTTVFSLADARTVRLIDAPPLAQQLPTSLASFPLVSSSTPVVRATLDTAVGTSCTGFLPSRLPLGGQARVTPGQPNRVRREPTTGSPVVGQIPGEGIFTVLEGPVCDPANAIAWWRVDYQGMTGWTAEGQGSDYWTEPLNP
jgi:hypothetical protein